MQKQFFALSILLSCAIAQFAEAKTLSEPPDQHACGSTSSAEYPNGPKVRLFFKESGNEHPSKLDMFFIDKKGAGYFKDVISLSQNDVEKTWSLAKQDSKGYLFWGTYSFERSEPTRKKYGVSFQFKDGQIDAYKISGPHIDNPAWITMHSLGSAACPSSLKKTRLKAPASTPDARPSAA